MIKTNMIRMALSRKKLGNAVLIIGFAFLVAGCGGSGGGGSGSSYTPSTPADLTVSGTAATGMAIAGAIISAKCQVGTGTATTIGDGTFSLVLAGGKLPCVVQITNPLDGLKLHTVATGSGSTAIANITPLTEMLTARVLGNDPVVFFAAFDAAIVASTVTPAAVKAAQTDVVTILTGTVDTSSLADFISTPLKAATQGNVTGGDAQDKLLDALRAKLNNAQLAQVVTALAHTTNTADIKEVVATMEAAPPAAKTGGAQSVVAGTTVTLDGSASTAALGRVLTYAWTLTAKPAGSSATLTSSTSVKPTLTADLAGTYVAALIVNDGMINSAAATTTITASTANAAPVANAGPAQYDVTGTLVTVNGSASSDANGDQLTYVWTLTSRPAGSSASLTNPTSAKPTFTADAAGLYVASLVVSDGLVNSDAATVTVSVTISATSSTVTSASATPTSLLAGATASYDFSFNATSGLPTGSTITVVYPAEFNVVGATKSAYTSYISLQSISGQTITYTVSASGVINSGSNLYGFYTTTGGIINPSTPGTYALHISTSSDPAPVSVPVAIR